MNHREQQWARRCPVLQWCPEDPTGQVGYRQPSTALLSKPLNKFIISTWLLISGQRAQAPRWCRAYIHTYIYTYKIKYIYYRFSGLFPPQRFKVKFLSLFLFAALQHTPHPFLIFFFFFGLLKAEEKVNWTDWKGAWSRSNQALRKGLRGSPQKKVYELSCPFCWLCISICVHFPAVYCLKPKG